MIMRLCFSTVSATFDIMLHLPKEQSDYTGFLLFDLAQSQHHPVRKLMSPGIFQTFLTRKSNWQQISTCLLVREQRWGFSVSLCLLQVLTSNCAGWHFMPLFYFSYLSKFYLMLHHVSS